MSFTLKSQLRTALGTGLYLAAQLSGRSLQINFPAKHRHIIRNINRRIDEEKPWELAKQDNAAALEDCLNSLISDLLSANRELSPFLPGASEKITAIFSGLVEPPKVPLFPKS